MKIVINAMIVAMPSLQCYNANDGIVLQTTLNMVKLDLKRSLVLIMRNNY